jgi:cytochrome c oxidase subunit 3
VQTRNSLGQLSIPFFVIAAALLGSAMALAWALPGWPELVGQPPGTLFPPVFAVSTACLVFGSWSLSRAEAHVVRERQEPFRRSLRQALAAGTCFVAVQTYALVHFFQRQTPWQAASGATEFVAVAAALHGLHFLVAWLFLLFVGLQAHADRYDHEYHWGVTFCAWFWHALGAVWLIVLCVMAIANQGLVDDGVMFEMEP